MEAKPVASSAPTPLVKRDSDDIIVSGCEGDDACLNGLYVCQKENKWTSTPIWKKKDGGKGFIYWNSESYLQRWKINPIENILAWHFSSPNGDQPKSVPPMGKWTIDGNVSPSPPAVPLIQNISFHWKKTIFSDSTAKPRLKWADENKQSSKHQQVKVLPYFHKYNSEGRLKLFGFLSRESCFPETVCWEIIDLLLINYKSLCTDKKHWEEKQNSNYYDSKVYFAKNIAGNLTSMLSKRAMICTKEAFDATLLQEGMYLLRVDITEPRNGYYLHTIFNNIHSPTFSWGNYGLPANFNHGMHAIDVVLCSWGDGPGVYSNKNMHKYNFTAEQTYRVDFFDDGKNYGWVVWLIRSDGGVEVLLKRLECDVYRRKVGSPRFGFFCHENAKNTSFQNIQFMHVNSSAEQHVENPVENFNECYFSKPNLAVR